MNDGNDSNTTDFLGTGWAFPPSFGANGANVAMVRGPEDVQQALHILFSTRPGERLMNDGFGCAPDGFMFAEVNAGLIGQIKAMVDDALLAYEPRIRVQQVTVTEESPEQGVLRIHVDYLIPETNSRYNVVFPFYLNEATDLELP